VKILITGGLGLIGHHLIKHLYDLGYQVTGIDNATDYGVCDSSTIKALISSRLESIPDDINIYKTDINYYSELSNIFENESFDTVIHLASFPRQKTVEKNPSLAARTMIEGTMNVLRASSSINRFIFISSSMVYGDFNGSVDEESPCNPKGQYGILKLAGENLVKDWSKSTNIPYTIIRPSAVYGSRDIDDRIVPKFLNAAAKNQTLNVNGKDESIDFTHVDDLVEGIALAVKNKQAENQTFNMTRGSARTIYDAAKIAVDLAGTGRISINGPDSSYPSRGTLDISKAKRILHYNPSIDIESGFEKTYQWLIQNK
jgi:nucleoside-diphosphate-sugar epimerase